MVLLNTAAFLIVSGRIKLTHPGHFKLTAPGGHCLVFSKVGFQDFSAIFFRVWKDRALRERNSSVQTSVDCVSILPGRVLPRRDPDRFWGGCHRQPRPKRKTHFFFPGPLGTQPLFCSSSGSWKRPPWRSR